MNFVSKEELQALLKPLSDDDKSLLFKMLEEENYESAFAKMQASNPLKGSVVRYVDPFEPACDSSDWEVLRDSD